MVKLTLGCDPEFFLKDKASGKLIASCGRVGGSKEHPLPIDDKGHAIQEDNVAVEFCIPPASDILQWDTSIQFVMGHISELVSKQGLTINLSASEIFPDDELQTQQAKEFGCDPDYNAYTLDQNPRPSATDPCLRSAGGHIHFGWGDSTDDQAIRIIKASDLFLGIPSVLMDTDERRKELYGKAGAFRRKPYGVEYRTLSNFWLKTKELREWAFTNAQRTFNEALVGHHEIFNDERFAAMIQSTINNNDKKMAERFVSRFNLGVV